MTLIEYSAANHLESIDMSHIDLAFPIENRQQHPYDAYQIWRENVFAALLDGHPLRTKSELSWSDLAHESFLVCSGGRGDEVRDYLSLRLGQMGSHPRFLIQNIERYSLLTLVALRRGVAPTLESETAISIPGVIYRPIAGERLPFFAIASPRNDNPAARTLLSLARTMAHPSAPFAASPASDLDSSNAVPLRTPDPSP
ncbi:LysR family substrate-binding domain-containing protein [Xanthobacter sp. V4C-4]|uniref:LysR family substrate-binding domain-containing protein n=1 Tax=Xanthobacter cornucopiae TaxID=3119924 RepID=UPI003729DC20